MDTIPLHATGHEPERLGVAPPLFNQESIEDMKHLLRDSGMEPSHAYLMAQGIESPPDGGHMPPDQDR